MHRPSISRIRSFCFLHTRRKMAWLVRKLGPKMLCNLRSRSNPHSLFLRDIFHDLLEGCESSWLADAAAMKRDCHHLRRAFTAFFVEYIECILDVVVEVSWRTEAGRDVEFVVIAV